MRRIMVLALALPWWAGCALSRLYAEPLSPQGEIVTARTEDGWSIAMIRHRAEGSASGPPVLLCHGISANARNLDLDAEHSLARWLAAHGRETFAMSLRGVGDSDRPDPHAGRSFGYSMDTYAAEDLPAALARVRELTGAPQVDFVGHSMGGLVGYIYLARGGKGIGSAAFLGSPTRFVWGHSRQQDLARAGGLLADSIEYLDVPALAHMTAPFHGKVPTLFDVLLYNPDNVSPTLWRKFVATGVGSISGGVLRQFTLWMQTDKMLSADGTMDYREALAAVTTPVLVVAGKLDRIAPAPHVKDGFDHLGGPKSFFIAGEANGFRHDYGHMDLILGDRAPVELWPRVLAFLEAHP